MDKKKRRANIIVFIVLAVALAAAAKPAMRFFSELIFTEGTTVYSETVVLLICGALAIIVLTVLSGVLALTNGPAKGSALLIFAVAVICGMMLYLSIRDAPAPEAEPTGTPRPTVTPPEVEIVIQPRKSANPESGTVIYRRYSNQPAWVSVQNNSQSDICFRMVDRHGVMVLIFYVRAGESCKLPAPTGTYFFLCATGRLWEGEETYFGEKTRFRKLPDYFPLDKGSVAEIVLSPGLPELKDITQKEYEDYWK
jgi:hypothetical protein